jgi:hypothetical protein
MPNYLLSNVQTISIDLGNQQEFPMNAEAVKEVAQDSRTKAEAHLSQGNWGRAFAHLLLCVKLQPTWKSDLQSAVSNCLSEFS